MIVLSAFLVTLEIFYVNCLIFLWVGADELSGYGFGVATTFALSFALLERAHIRVDAVIAVLPKRLHVAINFLGLWLLIGFAFILTAMVWSMVADTLTHGSRSITPMRVPLMIPQLP